MGRRVAIVLPGGGARGAYEAGALDVLLPALEARGERPAILCGTSVGAINAATLGSLADRPAAEQAAALVDRWAGMRKQDVVRPIVGPGLPVIVARMLGDTLGLPGLRLASLMDPTPLQASLDRWIDWLALHRNVKAGLVDAVCVVATSLSRGGPVAFTHTAGPVPPSREEDAPAYVPTPLGPEHVRASAAIPLLFPPVEVTAPARAAGHYVDGAVRLNSPISPALALGADSVVVIGFEPFAARTRPATPLGTPGLSDVLANVLDGLLVDQVADDLHRLAAINDFFVEPGATGPGGAARDHRAAQGRPPYRKVAYALVAPETRGEIAAAADAVFRERYGGLRGLLSPDYPLISRLLGGGRAVSRGELLSFLLFDPAFTARLIELGRRDAQRWLDRHPRLWCADASHDLGVDAGTRAAVTESRALDEYRELRRR